MTARIEHGVDARPTLVLGGTGKTGARVARRLAQSGHPVRIGSRRADPPFDWDDPGTWRPAVSGCGAVYISYQPDLAAPGAVSAVAALAEVAVSQGAGRLVLLSGRGEAEAEAAEQAIRTAGADWTILRASWFSQNFSESFLVDQVKAGVVALPVGDVREPFVDADDIADVAVAALTEDGHAGQLYELTGPRLMTFAEALDDISAATGLTVRFERVAPEAYAAMLADHGLPSNMADLLMYLFTTVLDGRNERLAEGVAQALGRPPRDFADYARAAAAARLWDTGPGRVRGAAE